MAYFKVIHNPETDQWRWQLREDNHEIIAIGETHPSQANALRAINALTASAVEASGRAIVVDGDGEDSP
jgi:uncharacterized protein YegP (UPF0339 family)